MHRRRWPARCSTRLSEEDATETRFQMTSAIEDFSRSVHCRTAWWTASRDVYRSGWSLGGWTMIENGGSSQSSQPVGIPSRRWSHTVRLDSAPATLACMHRSLFRTSGPQYLSPGPRLCTVPAPASGLRLHQLNLLLGPLQHLSSLYHITTLFIFICLPVWSAACIAFFQR